MSSLTPKPYLIRAIYDWCVDSGYTPYLSVRIGVHTLVPVEYARDGRIVLNIAPSATQGLTIDDVWVRFSARFNGVSRRIEVPIASVESLYARENGEGLSFPVEEDDSTVESLLVDSAPADEEPEPPKPKKSHLQIVK